MDQLDPPYTFILNKLNAGRVIPFLGAGASLGGRLAGATWKKGVGNFLPTARELAGHLADTTEFPSDESRDLTKVAQYFSVVGGRQALNEELHDIFNCDYQLTSLHTFLAEVPAPLLIVTTNYDDLIERAFDEKNLQLGAESRPYDVVIHTTDIESGDRLLWWPYGAATPREVDPNKLDIELGQRTVVYKMHGAIDRRHPSRDQYVITEDDYIDFLARMTKNKAVPMIFAELFQTRHFLFLGYGLNDWNLRVVLNRIEKDLRRPKGITSWAIQYQTRPLETRFWQVRGVEVYDQDLAEFVRQLTSRNTESVLAGASHRREITSSSERQRLSPFKGLIPYSEADALFFFGREKETRLITANLFGSPLTLLYGASGVGKTSVLRAGVAHQLRRRDGVLVVVFNSWQRNPTSDLMPAVADSADLADHDAWTRAVSFLPKDRPASLTEFLAICAAQLNRRLMIILDQFEEYFLYHPEDDEFASEFSRAVTQTDAPVSFLISIREDSLAKLDRFEGRIPSLFDNYLRIEHLSYDAARDAILKPIERNNELLVGHEPSINIEGPLVNAVLDQVQTGQVILGETGRSATNREMEEVQIETPFLQLVMTRLWREEMLAGSRLLRLETLSRLGGAERIVKNHLDEVMDQLSPSERNVAAKVFPHLVTRSRTKIAYPVFDLVGEEGIENPQLTSLLKKLSGEEMLAGDHVRILRQIPAMPGQSGGTRYEIFHDVLAAAILDWRSRYVQQQELYEAERRAEEQQRSIAASSILANLGSELADSTKKAAATEKLQRIFAALEKDQDVAEALKTAGASSDDKDGGSLRRVLIMVRRRAASARNPDLPNKINRAIVDNGQ